jgi:hypothetical protein
MLAGGLECEFERDGFFVERDGFLVERVGKHFGGGGGVWGGCSVADPRGVVSKMGSGGLRRGCGKGMTDLV